jgi:hypothetical protein
MVACALIFDQIGSQTVKSASRTYIYSNPSIHTTPKLVNTRTKQAYWHGQKL